MPPDLQATIDSLSEGDEIRVVLENGKEVIGRFGGVTWNDWVGEVMTLRSEIAGFPSTALARVASIVQLERIGGDHAPLP